MTHTIEFPAPAELLSLNKRLHWAHKAELTAEWRLAAMVHGRNSGLKNLRPAVVTVLFTVARHRRRDPHNFIATVKPIIDGLVDAKFWPDDTAEWVAVTDPVFNVVGFNSSRKDRVIVQIKEIP